MTLFSSLERPMSHSVALKLQGWLLTLVIEWLGNILQQRTSVMQSNFLMVLPAIIGKRVGLLCFGKAWVIYKSVRSNLAQQNILLNNSLLKWLQCQYFLMLNSYCWLSSELPLPIGIQIIQSEWFQTINLPKYFNCWIFLTDVALGVFCSSGQGHCFLYFCTFFLQEKIGFFPHPYRYLL